MGKPEEKKPELQPVLELKEEVIQIQHLANFVVVALTNKGRMFKGYIAHGSNKDTQSNWTLVPGPIIEE